jgi:hypothetical protein
MKPTLLWTGNEGETLEVYGPVLKKLGNYMSTGGKSKVKRDILIKKTVDLKWFGG